MRINRPGGRALREFARYHYLTSTQLTKLLFARSSRTFAQATLKGLTDEGLLTRDALPQKRQGNPIGVWTPKKRGRQAHSSLFLEHTLAVTDLLMAFAFLEEEGVEIVQLEHDLSLKRHPVAIGGGKTYAPDGIVELGLPSGRMGIALEMDLSTEQEHFWRKKVRSLLAFGDGPFAQYGLSSLTIAVVAPHGRRRVEELLRWTEAELRAQQAEEWGIFFWFLGLDPGHVVPPRWEPLEGDEISVRQYFGDARWLNPFERVPKPLIGGGE